MTRYLSLLKFTETGIQNVALSTNRATHFRELVENAGGRILFQYWAVGDVDGCVAFEAPDEEAAATLLLSLGKAGDVQTSTLRVFEQTEFERIVAKV